MSLDWRTGAFAAGAAFILSFLAGIIGGVSFGALLFRAIIGAVVFGAGGVGVSLLIERYLPELKAAGGDSPGDDLDQRPGGRVDITVDDSMDADVDSSFVLDGEGDDDSDTGGGDFVAGIAADEVRAEPEAADGEPVDEDDEVDDVDEVDEVDEEGDDEEIAELEEAEDEGDEGDLERPTGATVPEAGSAQSLPDIEGFSGSFTEAPAEVEDIDGAQRSGEDPSIMARAIRTVLKREE